MPPNTPIAGNQNAAPAPPVLPPTSPNSHRRKREGLRSIITTVLILLAAPIIALLITGFVFQSYEVDGPSMQPTLENHDRLVIWKFGRTWSKITKDDYIPARGSVIVFVKRGLYDFNSDKEKQLIKRVVGLPGDHVVIQDGSVTIYNDEHPDGYDPDDEFAYGTTIQQQTTGTADFTIKPGEVFVIGDNRDNSLDSRYFGPIPADDIVGTLSARILPLSEAKKF